MSTIWLLKFPWRKFPRLCRDTTWKPRESGLKTGFDLTCASVQFYLVATQHLLRSTHELTCMCSFYISLRVAKREQNAGSNRDGRFVHRPVGHTPPAPVFFVFLSKTFFFLCVCVFKSVCLRAGDPLPKRGHRLSTLVPSAIWYTQYPPYPYSKGRSGRALAQKVTRWLEWGCSRRGAEFPEAGAG